MRSKLLAGLALVCSAACAAPPERLTIEAGSITVYNDTSEAWNGLEIWVNDHYRVTRETMAPEERFTAPLEAFVAGFGQRFARNQQVTGVEVTATDASGDPVRLVWGGGRRR